MSRRGDASARRIDVRRRDEPARDRKGTPAVSLLAAVKEQLAHDPMFARELAPLVAPYVVPHVMAQIAAALVPTSAPYSTRRGRDVPPEYAGRRKAWLAIAPTIPGAVRLGRWCEVPRAAYAAWLTSQAEPVNEKSAAPANDEPWSPERALQAVGLRPTWGRR